MQTVNKPNRKYPLVGVIETDNWKIAVYYRWSDDDEIEFIHPTSGLIYFTHYKSLCLPAYCKDL